MFLAYCLALYPFNYLIAIISLEVVKLVELDFFFVGAKPPICLGIFASENSAWDKRCLKRRANHLKMDVSVPGHRVIQVIGTFRIILTLEVDEPRKLKRRLSKQSNDANSRFLILLPISRSLKFTSLLTPMRIMNYQIVLLYG